MYPARCEEDKRVPYMRRHEVFGNQPDPGLAQGHPVSVKWSKRWTRLAGTQERQTREHARKETSSSWRKSMI